MGRAKIDKRSRLIDSATKLTHMRGFGRTALADIARDANVPLGNIYYYFKTKGEIGEAVIAQQTAAMHELRERLAPCSPKERLMAFIQFVADNRAGLARSGCPMGSLCSELNKDDSMLATQSGEPFQVLLSWLETQFAAIGKSREKSALALHLLSALQGAALLASTFRDPELVVVETDQLREWLRGL